MRAGVKGLIAGAAVIVASALLLLVSDLSRHKPSDHYRIALMQISGSYVLEETINGIIDGFEENDFIVGRNLDLKIFNPENDVTAAGNMAQTIMRDPYDLIMTVSTPALQIIANANRQGRFKHIFGAVTDPYSAEVGISGVNHAEHPSWMTGIGTFQPVAETIMLARRMNPKLRKIGTIINPHEACSIACMTKAEKTARGLGMKLEVIKVGDSIAAIGAVDKLLSRNVEAIFIGGDNTVEPSSESISRIALKKGIPTFGYAPLHAGKGCLAGFGADYYEVGRVQAMLAVEVLRGLKPGEIPVENLVPNKLALNLSILPQLQKQWEVGPEIIHSAAIIIDRNGLRTVSNNNNRPDYNDFLNKLKLNRKSAKKLCFVNYTNSSTCEENLNGFLAGMERMGMVLGENFELKITNAEGSNGSLRKLLEDANRSNVDIILTSSTQALQMALSVIKSKPVVFSIVGDPIRAGAGQSATEHRHNFTGVACMSDFERMIGIIKMVFPEARRIGTLYCPDELNSVIYRDRFAQALADAKLELVSLPVRFSADIKNESHHLISQKIDIFCQISDNLHNASFGDIAQACYQSKVPLLSFVFTNAVANGAAIAIGSDYEEGGWEQAWLTTQIMHGKSPGELAFRKIKRSRLVINQRNARQLGIHIPVPILKIADLVVD